MATEGKPREAGDPDLAGTPDGVDIDSEAWLWFAIT